MAKPTTVICLVSMMISTTAFVLDATEDGFVEQPREIRLSHAVSAADELDAVRSLAKVCSTAYGVLRLQTGFATRSNAEIAERVYAAAGQTLEEALRTLNDRSTRYNVRFVGGVLIATDRAIKESENPLLVVVETIEYKGTVDGLMRKVTKEVLDMGPPMYAFSNGEGREFLTLPVHIRIEGKRTVAEIFAETSRLTGLNWQMTLMSNGRELFVDPASNEIRAIPKARLIITLERANSK